VFLVASKPIGWSPRDCGLGLCFPALAAGWLLAGCWLAELTLPVTACTWRPLGSARVCPASLKNNFVLSSWPPVASFPQPFSTSSSLEKPHSFGVFFPPQLSFFLSLRQKKTHTHFFLLILPRVVFASLNRSKVPTSAQAVEEASLPLSTPFSLTFFTTVSPFSHTHTHHASLICSGRGRHARRGRVSRRELPRV